MGTPVGSHRPAYGKPAAMRKSRAGRPQIALEIMLRLYFLQQWYALADEALEGALYDSQALRQFARIDLNQQSVPDATTLLHFRHLLEQQQLTQALFAEINAMLSERGAADARRHHCRRHHHRRSAVDQESGQGA